MLAAWFSSRKRRARRQIAAGLAEWLDSVRHILDDCASALAASSPPDSGTTLDAIDRALMRFNQCASEVRAPLRRSHPQLASQLRQCTDLAYHLRNHTRTYLLRAADVLALQHHDLFPSPCAAHGVDEAHQQAARAAALLRQELNALGPELHRLISDWSTPE